MLKNKMCAVLLCLVIQSCTGILGGIPVNQGGGVDQFPPCDTPEAVRCNGQVAERCEGGNWYPDMDCSDVGQTCSVSDAGGKEVVRCE